MRSKKKKKSSDRTNKRFDFNVIIGKQLARLRFGVTYIQMFYYASVILGAIVLVVDSVFGSGKMGWEISIAILFAIFIIEWGMGYYTEKKQILQRDRTQDFIQNIPANTIVARETWEDAIIPQFEEMFERVLVKSLDNLNIKQKDEIVKEANKSIKQEKTK
jgi:hypothetical protein